MVSRIAECETIANSKEDYLDEAKRRFDEIRQSMSQLPEAKFKAAIRTIKEAASCIKESNSKKALKLLELAAEQVGKEKSIVLTKSRILDMRSNSSDQPANEIERELEKRLDDALDKGSFDDAAKIVTELENEIKKNVTGNIGNFLEIAPPPDITVELGKGNTIEVLLSNNSSMPVKILALSCKSNHARATVLSGYKNLIGPRSNEIVSLNLIPNMEGDIVIELIVEIESCSKATRTSRSFSVKVISSRRMEYAPVSQPRMMPTNEVGLDSNSAIKINHSPAVSDRVVSPLSNKGEESSQISVEADSIESMILPNPIELIENGSVDIWIQSILNAYSQKECIDLTGLSQAHPAYQMKEGYCNLYLSVFCLDVDKTGLWEAWAANEGIKGDEFTNRCFDMLLRFVRNGGKIEFEHDNSVESTNKEYFTNMLHIAAGMMSIDRTKRRDIKSWEIRIKSPLKNIDRKYIIERKTIKGIGNSLTKSRFEIANTRNPVIVDRSTTRTTRTIKSK